MEMVVQPDRRVYAQASFNYEHLAPEVRTDVQESTRRIHELERRTSESIIEIGQQLIRVKQRLPHGEFLPWLDSEFGWTRQTANNFIRVAESFSNVKNLDIYAPSALYALASSNVPEEVREGFQQVAEAGEKVTHSAVKEAIEARREEEQRRVMLVDADSGEILDDEDNVPAPLTADDIRQRFENAPSGGASLLAGSALGAQNVAQAKNAHVAYNSGENEWYTPEDYIVAARQVMGGIDLDPASSEIANRTVQASTFYTKDDNGLTRDWYGRVWMNPPYAQPLIQHFAEKIADEFNEGNVDEAIILVNNATETRWFQYMAECASSICFPAGRIRFLDPAGNPGAPLQGQAIVYLGANPDAFKDHFGAFGVVL